MSRAGKLTAMGVFALLALQVYWHVLRFPASVEAPWLPALLFLAPLLPSVVLYLLRRPSARFWAGVACLFYFSHGITESWFDAQARTLALVELALSLWIIVGGSWDGIAARFKKRRPPPANV